MAILKITHLLAINSVTISILNNGIPLLFKISPELLMEVLTTMKTGNEINYEFDATDPLTITSIWKAK